MSHEEPFKVHLRRESNYETSVTVRFEVVDGMGILGLRVPGREDPTPSVHREEANIEADDLRAGRFVHVLSGGRRQSYALSRVTVELVERLSEGNWIVLEAITEYGFRYLVPPEDLGEEASAAVKLESAAPTAAIKENFGAAAAHMRPAARPKSVALASKTGASAAAPKPAPAANPAPQQASNPPASTNTPKQVPVAPALAQSALSALTHPQAIAALQVEMQKVADLHQHAADLERRLQESKAREADLLGVLGSWQSRG